MIKVRLTGGPIGDSAGPIDDPTGGPFGDPTGPIGDPLDPLGTLLFSSSLLAAYNGHNHLGY